MKDTVLKLLNIRSSEAWLVRSLFLVQLFQGIGIAYLFTSANALFLTQYSVEELPKVYMLSALILLLVNYVYTKLEHRISIQKLILYVLLFSVLSILGLRLLIYSVEYRYGAYWLMIWYQVIYLLCSSSFWALAALVFDVRESKRTFSILSAGDIPAKLLGYLSVSALAALFGLSNVLFISVICMILSMIFMQRMLRSKKIHFSHLAHKAHHGEPLKNQEAAAPWDIIKSIFGNQLIFLIAVLSLIVVISMTVNYFTFLSEVKSRFHSDVQLATFLGYFFGIGSVLAILAKITLTSRIVQRLGISISLMILPFLIFALTIFILLYEQMGSHATFYLYAFGSMVVFSEILKSTIQEPLALVLFQPLKPLLRLKGHIISKGILGPLGLFLAGFFIYFNISRLGEMNIATTCYLLLSLCLVWVIIIYLLDKQYLASLVDSLKSGFFRGNFILKDDSEVKQMLHEKLKSTKSLDIIYAADMLEKLDQKAFRTAIIPLLRHPDPNISKFILRKIPEHEIKAAIPELKSLLEGPIDDDLKIEVLKVLSHLQDNHSELLLEYLDHPSPLIQQETIVALFTSADLNAIIRAGQKLIAWIDSEKEKDRMTAAVIIGRIGDKNFYTSLVKLINDPSTEVQRSAMAASSQIRNMKLVPLLIEKLNHAEMRNAAIAALAAQGEEVLDHIIAMEEKGNIQASLITYYIRVAVLVGGQKAQTYLQQLLLTHSNLKHEIIVALKEVNYSAPRHLHGKINELLKSELEDVNKIILLRSSIHSRETEILSNALLIELQNREADAFYLLSFIHDRAKILEAFNNMRSGKKERIANAIEVLDLTVSKKLRARLISLMEYLYGNVTIEPMKSTSIQATTNLVKKLLHGGEVPLSGWTRAAAVYCLYLLHPTGDYNFLRSIPDNGDYIFEETKNFILAKNS